MVFLIYNLRRCEWFGDSGAGWGWVVVWGRCGFAFCVCGHSGGFWVGVSGGLYWLCGTLCYWFALVVGLRCSSGAVLLVLVFDLVWLLC